jgi:hypothetical protein
MPGGRASASHSRASAERLKGDVLNTDIRVGVDFPDHVKTQRLVRACGERAVRCLLRLWTWVSISRPKGDLSDMSPEEIETQAGWTGKRGAFFAALSDKKIRFIDVRKKKIFLHDWMEHNSYAYYAPERRIKAQIGALEKHGKTKAADKLRKKLAATRTATRKPAAKEKQCGSDAGSNAPSPSPSPSPKKGRVRALPGNGGAAEGASGPPPSDEEREEYETLKPHIQKQCAVLMSHFGIQSSFDLQVHRGPRFHPVGFVHYARKSAIPARVIVKVLDSMVRQKENIANPYGWLRSVLSSEYQEYSYTEELEEHEQRKSWGLDSIGSFLRGGSSR